MGSVSTEWVWPNATVTRVIDGDTLVACVERDLGFHGTASFEVKLRLNRLNSPPLHTDAGKSSASALSSLVLGSLLTITTVGPYKYGDEWMAEIVLPDGRNVSDEMIRSGYSQPWDGTGKRPGG